ncbi:metallophosphoesterase family protein [Vibrio superstes]|uniref:Calcineurin-like phosphoesterase domain-containing protein n=1 Tax=Vibrio superstes NBRC 103154 TaxID=1219062 RepID=A0A511QQL6_9VIBR|nr:metallophosphoesterase [Vibrio superstes]GEM79591.1 hypothetical protein VSU01S_18360 [Vibrio superstes NBRC 103154]
MTRHWLMLVLITQSTLSFAFSAPEPPENTIRFAIIGDLTGGEREGVFNVAAEGIEQLQPDFIMSIGDLIEGGTEDEIQMNQEWAVFQKNLGNQGVPFYPAVGNHDISNSKMREWYEKNVGPRYYHFVYQDALFVVMDSEDFTNDFFSELKVKRDQAIEVYKADPTQFEQTEYANLSQRYYGEISDKQRDYVIKALDENPDVRWTFFFMHKPVWQNAEEQNFKRIETHLMGRNYTVFNGHVHSYQHTQRLGQDYIQLATSGGKIFEDQLINMDHITWVGLSGEKPTYLNIKLDGMRDKQGNIPANGNELCFDDPSCAQ